MTLFLDETDVAGHLSMERLIDVMRAALADFSAGKVQQPVRTMVARDKAPSLVEMLELRGFADMTLDQHFAAWSMIEFLQDAHPGFLGKLFWAVKGLKNEQGFPAGDRVGEAHRAAFEEELAKTWPMGSPDASPDS